MSRELPFGPIVADGFANIERVWTKALVPFMLVAAIPSAFAFLDPQKLKAENSAIVLPIMLIGLIAFLMATGLAYRLAATETPPQKVRFKILGLQWGTMEERYLISLICMNLLILFYAILVVFLTLVFAAIIAYGRGHELTMDGMPAIMNELGSVGASAVLLVAAIGALGGFWLYVRVSLSQVASLYGGEIRVLSSSHLTKGRVLALVLPLLLIGLMHGDSPLTMRFGVDGPVRILFNIVSVIWTVFVQIPFSAGVFASIYQRLKAADKVGSDRPDSALGNGSNDGVFTD
ncbi:MAG: hypothetical protein RLZZ141_1561 [Pseudomonadota bacterium]|jgi:hypothetical protein